MGQRWERELPRPPSRGDVLRETILRHIRWHEMRPVPDIHQCVLNDYGQVTDRTVYRHIRALIDAGEIKRVEDDSEATFGYVRARGPKWDRTQQVWI